MNTRFILAPSLALLLLLTLLTGSSFADFIDDFARQSEVLTAKISPDGKHVAVLRELDGQRIVLMLSYPQMKVTGTLSFPGDNEVDSFWWVNNERIIASVTRNFTNLEENRGTGELFAINTDGSKPKHLFGIRAGGAGRSAGRTRQVESEAASGFFLHRLPGNKKEVLIEIRNWSLSANNVTQIARLNVYTGKTRSRLNAPAINADIVTDASGEVRFAFATDDDNNTVVYLRDPKTNRWSEFSRTPYGDAQSRPITVCGGWAPVHEALPGRRALRDLPHGPADEEIRKGVSQRNCLLRSAIR